MTVKNPRVRVLPQYGPDNGPPTIARMRQIRKLTPQKAKRSIRSSLLYSDRT